MDEKFVSQQLVFFSRPKHLELQDPELRADVREENGDFILSTDADYPALWVWPELVSTKAAYSKRFFHIFPGNAVEVRVQPEEKMSLEEFRVKLKLWSLMDTLQREQRLFGEDPLMHKDFSCFIRVYQWVL